MATELYSEIKKQVALLSADEMLSLASFLNEEAKKKVVFSGTAEETRERKSINKNRSEQIVNWLKAHETNYGGKYVALYGDDIELVGMGKTLKEANEQAKQKGIKDAFVVYLPLPDEVLFGGW